MNEQLTILALPSKPEQPRCRMCARPAWWLQRAQKWGTYCGSTNCQNRERLCQTCEITFTVGIDGAGTKYCSINCRSERIRRAQRGQGAICAWCNKASETAFRGGKWPYICAECQYPIRHVVPRLKDHNVPHETARRLLTNPGCEVCGTDMLERRRQSNAKVAAMLVVDHDHNCCPVEKASCGKCIRGLICRHCNAAAGQLYDNPETARALATYLESVRTPQQDAA